MAVQRPQPFSSLSLLIETLTREEVSDLGEQVAGWELRRGVKFDGQPRVWTYPFTHPEQVAKIWDNAQHLSISFLWFEKKDGNFFSHCIRREGNCLELTLKTKTNRYGFAPLSSDMNREWVQREIESAGFFPP